MRIIRASACRTMPWKNGGGTTTEIAAHPPGASLDGFDWRISMAHVGSDGPFSVFPGIDRTLSVLTGRGIVLAFGEGESKRLERSTEPYPFAADRPVEGQLVDGPIDDLNVMTRRGRWLHKVTRFSGTGPFQLDQTGELVVLVARSDGWTIARPPHREILATGDSALLESVEGVVLTNPHDSGEIFAIVLSAAPQI
ncbi:HutD family protein [Bosea sp. 2YAB26]|uniref:HutD/Ves family protein n=1 Tax=unclassified Bosea (in: a-proteobacteria) TaxID=2653178 RepID=UPI003F93DF72